MKASSLAVSFLYMIRLLISLFFLWLKLGWKVRKARKAFEKQLIRQGMAKKDAERLSAFYSKLKDNIMTTLKGSMFRNR